MFKLCELFVEKMELLEALETLPKDQLILVDRFSDRLIEIEDEIKTLQK